MTPAELDIVELVGDLVLAGTPAQLVGRVAALVGRAAFAGAGDVTSGVTGDAVTVPAGRVSKAALRTRRWRERKRLAAGADPGLESVTVTSQTVTEASPKASPVTVGDGGGDAIRQKEFPPTPPLRKTSLPQKGVSKRRRRHRVTVDEAALPSQPQVFLDEHDARFRELEAMRGRSYPRQSGGWWFEPFLIAQVEERLRSKVTRLRPSTVAMTAATGPPGRVETG